jgi:hypothetical protein
MLQFRDEHVNTETLPLAAPSARDLFWPKEGALRAVWPILALTLIPILFAIPLIAFTTVEVPRYVFVVKLLTAVAISYGGMIAVFGLLWQRFKSGTREPVGVSLIWYMGGALIAGMTIPTFGIFKQILLPVQGFPWDVSLAAFDRVLFLGNDPWRVTHALFGSVNATWFLDKMYSFWMIIMYGFPAIIVAMFDDRAMRIRLIGSWIASWVFIGSLAAWVFASAGPCYYDELIGPNASFAELKMRLTALANQAHAAGFKINAIDFQPMLLGAYNSGHYAPAGGISAMPSMHLAMATLFVITGFEFRRWLGIIMSVYWVIIWIGSIHLGWHYAADGLVAGVMMVGLWVIIRRAQLRFGGSSR